MAAKSLGDKVSIVVNVEAIVTVPLAAVDVDSDALVDEKIPVPHAGNVSLRFNPMTGEDEADSHDCFVARSAVCNEMAKKWLHASGRQSSDSSDFIERQEVFVDRRLHRGKGVFRVETANRPPQRLHAAHMPAIIHFEVRVLTVKAKSGNG